MDGHGRRGVAHGRCLLPFASLRYDSERDSWQTSGRPCAYFWGYIKVRYKYVGKMKPVPLLVNTKGTLSASA